MIKLTDDEKKYLWGKLEYTKKKKATETKNDIYEILQGDKSEISEEEFIKILNSLEFTFRSKLKEFDKPMGTESFKSIQGKLPETWIGVKQSSLAAKKRKDEKLKKNEHVKTFDEFENLNS